MTPELEDHFQEIARQVAEGRMVPFLGAGVNLCGRPDGSKFEPRRHLPSGRELSEYLAGRFQYPEADKGNLLRVSQYVEVKSGAGPLHDELHRIFDHDYEPTPLHRFLAGLPRLRREKGLPAQYGLIVTANYDDVLERAFREADEPFHLVTYMAGEHPKFRHQPPVGKPRIIDTPNKYKPLMLDGVSVILKVHGLVERGRPDPNGDSYVITEDHYIDYLAHTDITQLFPVPLPEKLRTSHLLFLGYSLGDWNLRVILRRIWRDQPRRYQSWGIDASPKPLDVKFWNERKVSIIPVRLEDYVPELERRIRQWRADGGGT